MASPQTSVHVDGEVKVPGRQEYPGTGPIQFPRHLSRSDVLPSSHISPATKMPSPQIGVHVEGIVTELQVHPYSIWQRELHPSKAIVLLSSHYSEAVFTQSPQTSVQTEGEFTVPVVQDHPATAPVQFPRHLSASEVLPSSQISPGFTLPSPQIPLQIEG